MGDQLFLSSRSEIGRASFATHKLLVTSVIELSLSLFAFIALRIHISEVTKRILEALGGFIVESRGEVYLKVS